MGPNTESIAKETAIEIMLHPVYRKFNELLTNQLQNIPILMLGEDSVRYDFFYALSDVLKLKNWELQIEYPVHAESFIPRMDPKSKEKRNHRLTL